MTPAALEARRRNAQKSTGPRTEQGKRRAAQNGRRHAAPRISRCPAPTPGLTGSAEKLAHELAQAFEPANSAERLLVEELARLHFRKRGNQEAQEGLIQKNWHKLARDRAEHQRELTLECSDYPYHLAAAAGFLTMEDCPAKFRELSRLLNVVKDDVQQGNFSRDAEELLKTLYGPGPTMRGARVLGSYRRLLESGFAPRTSEAEAGPASPVAPPPEATEANSVPAPAAGQSEEARAARFDQASLEAARADLLRALQEEKSILAAKYVTYLDEHIPSPMAVERAALVPAEDAWRALIHQDQALDRQIESKTRLLLFMQWVRRSKEQREAALYREEGEASKG
jgi:hypothetical protein